VKKSPDEYAVLLMYVSFVMAVRPT